MGPAGPTGPQGPEGPAGSNATIATASASGFGPAVSDQTAFLVPPADVAITSATQRMHVQSQRAFGSTTTGGAPVLMLDICYQSTEPEAPIVSAGVPLSALQVPQNTRAVFGNSAIITGLEPGTYRVGLCGYSGFFARWNFNSEGSTTVLVF
jgi:hypothetical protein